MSGEDITVELDAGEDYHMEDEDASVRLKSAAIKRRGRGFEATKRDVEADRFEVLGGGGNELAQKSVEGWIIFVTGIHEEATEDHVRDKFADFGEIKSLHLNIDRQTGFVKGYAFIEYNKFEHGQEAINAMNGTDLLGKKIHCDWAFVKPTTAAKGRGGGGSGGVARRRGRSPSPDRR